MNPPIPSHRHNRRKNTKPAAVQYAEPQLQQTAKKKNPSSSHK